MTTIVTRAARPSSAVPGSNVTAVRAIRAVSSGNRRRVWARARPLLLVLLPILLLLAAMGFGFNAWRIARDNATIRALAAGQDIAVPTEASGPLLLGKVQDLARRGTTEAIEPLIEALDRRGETDRAARARFALANAYLRQAFDHIERGDLDPAGPRVTLARQEYRRALQGRPDFWDAKFNLDVASRLLRIFPTSIGNPATPSRRSRRRSGPTFPASRAVAHECRWLQRAQPARRTAAPPDGGPRPGGAHFRGAPHRPDPRRRRRPRRGGHHRQHERPRLCRCGRTAGEPARHGQGRPTRSPGRPPLRFAPRPRTLHGAPPVPAVRPHRDLRWLHAHRRRAGGHRLAHGVGGRQPGLRRPVPQHRHGVRTRHRPALHHGWPGDPAAAEWRGARLRRQAGAVRGLIVGAGASGLSPIPRYNDRGRQTGFYAAGDVQQENRFGPPRRTRRAARATTHATRPSARPPAPAPSTSPPFGNRICAASAAKRVSPTTTSTGRAALPPPSRRPRRRAPCRGTSTRVPSSARRHSCSCSVPTFCPTGVRLGA